MGNLREIVVEIIKEVFSEQGEAVAAPVVNSQVPPSAVAQPNVKLKPKQVVFNKGLETEYTVQFSERGFLIGNTRMSFEELDHALSKGYTITLKDGTMLDPVKMQQIKKYEDTY